MESIITTENLNERWYPENSEQVKPYMKACDLTHPARCADGRKQKQDLSQEEKLGEDGPHIIGGFYGIYYPAAAIATRNNIDIDQATLFDLVQKAFERGGVTPGVHVDTLIDHHHEINEDGTLLEGCGYEQRIEENAEIYNIDKKFTMAAADATRKAKENGIAVMILDGQHKEGFAVLNEVEGTTFDTEKADLNNKQGFAHDLWVTQKLFDSLTEILKDNGYEEFSKSLSESYKNLEREFIVTTLKMIGKVVIAESEKRILEVK